jgi:hypothetical protein
METTFTDSITFLTNGPSAACSKDPYSKTPDWPPVIHLGEDGVLVSWTNSGYPTVSGRRPQGRAVTIGGMPARIRTLPASACAGLGGDAGQEVTIQRPVAGYNWFTVSSCFRGPNVAANAAAFQRMLATVRIAKG